MSRKQVQSSAAGFITIVVFAIVLLGFRPGPDSTSAGDPAKPGQPVAMPANLAGVHITFGLKDTEVKDWDGEVSISSGKVLDVSIVQGNPKANAKGNKFSIRTTFAAKKKENKKTEMTRPVIRITFDAAPVAHVTIKTKQGNFDFLLSEVPATGTKTFLGGGVSLQREDAAVRIAGNPDTEEDYPALASAPDGKLWLVYSEYTKGKPYVTERVMAGNFDELVPKGNGDQIKLKAFDGKTWSAPIDVTAPGLDIWRPTVAVDKKGKVYVFWAQQEEGRWMVISRAFDPSSKRWTDFDNWTKRSGSGFAEMNVVPATDARGTVCLTWQRRIGSKFTVNGARFNPDSGALNVFSDITPTANRWSPDIATDSKGNAYIAYDTYEKDNYDIRLNVMKADTVKPETIVITNSPRFEARPSIAVDKQDRVWIAYEEGDEQWGKDYSTNTYEKIGFTKNPGNGLYIKRTIRVKCLVDGKVMEPAGDLQKAIAKRTANNRSMPRIAVDAQGGIWLTYRHHPRPLGTGEVWNSFVTRYDGKQWSTPRMLAHSENSMDNRPAMAPYGKGMMFVFSGDGRPNQLNRKQNDLYAALLPGGDVQPMELVGASQAPKAMLQPVHPNEAEDIARLRAHRTSYQGKKLHLIRGEFHRHTEYTAHRDQDGLLEDSWRYALDAGGLDWMGNADHDNGQHDEYSWWQIQKMTDLMHNPPSFVAVHSYERSVVYPNGHRNVIFPKRGIRPLPRGDLKGDPDKGTPDTKILYKYLKHFGGMCSSHTSGTSMGTDWRDNDSVYEPVVEIYQGHRHNYEYFGAPRSATADSQIGGYQPKGFINHALEKGYKLGFQSSSDHVSTHMSYGVVLTDDVSRQGIIDAFKRRHSYAATDNIILEFRCGKQMMGDIFDAKEHPAFEATVHGTAPVKRMSLFKNSKLVYFTEPNKRQAELSYTDKEAETGKVAYYYVRIEQADGNLAWASPMWITYRP